jgi:hypothetical protein
MKVMKSFEVETSTFENFNGPAQFLGFDGLYVSLDGFPVDVIVITPELVVNVVLVIVTICLF